MSTEIAKTGQPGFMELIQQAMTLPAADGLDRVQIIERLYELKERDDARTAQKSFDTALIACQKVMPRVEKNGLIDPQGAKVPYAKLEDLDRCIRPKYEEFGFSVSYDAPMAIEGGKIRVTATFTHIDGHSVTREITALPNTGDTGRLKTSPMQAAKKTITEGRRHLLEMFFNIITVGADDPTLKEPITQEQADDIRTRMNDLPQSQPGVLLAKLCTKYRVGQVELLRATQLEAVMADVASTEKLRRK